MIRAEVDMSDVEALNRMFTDVIRYTNTSVDKVIWQTMRLSLQSAAIATKPRKSKGKDGRRRGGLTDKHRFRPLEVMPSSMGYWYVREDGTGKPFEIKKKLNKKELQRKKLKPVKKGVKVYSKKKRGFTWVPYNGKRDKSKKIFKIPAAGLAKDGWLRSMRHFDEKKRTSDSDTNKRIKPIHLAASGELSALAINLVRYASKTSPASARYGLNKGRRRMEKVWLPKIDRSIESKFKRNVRRFL